MAMQWVERGFAALLIWGASAGVSLAADPLADQAARMTPQRDGVADVFVISIAGDGQQTVFGSEARLAAKLLGERYGGETRTQLLINEPAPDPAVPAATEVTVGRAIGEAAARMNKTEDVLVVFATSHGWHDGTISMGNKLRAFPPLSASAVARQLDEAGIENAVIIVSACYSGTWIDPLATPKRIVLTAARPDRTSFGCSDDRALTYFGEALFQEGMAKGLSLMEAFDQAKRLVTQWERRDRFMPSEPQEALGEAMMQRWAALEARVVSAQAPQPANAAGGVGRCPNAPGALTASPASVAGKC
jgi:hypothetical protein